jgi:hypothetical protein
MCEAVEAYVTGEKTYLELSDEISSERCYEEKQKLSVEQLFKWVNTVAKKAGSLLRQLQRHCMQSGIGYWRLESAVKSPRAKRAKTKEKGRSLDDLAEFINMAKALPGEDGELLTLAQLFLKTTEVRSWLLSQQSLQCELF